MNTEKKGHPAGLYLVCDARYFGALPNSYMAKWGAWV